MLNNVLLSNSIAPHTILATMIQNHEFMTRPITHRISACTRIFVAAFAITGLASFPWSVASKSNLSCTKTALKSYPKFVLSSDPANTLLNQAGIQGKKIRQTGKQALLRVVGNECGRMALKGGQPQFEEWYKIEVSKGPHLYIRKAEIRELNKNQKREVKDWVAIKTNPNIGGLKKHLKQYSKGISATAAEQLLTAKIKALFKSKVEFLDDKLDETHSGTLILKEKFFDGLRMLKSSPLNIMVPLAGKWDRFETESFKIVDLWNKINQDVQKLKSDGQSGNYPTSLKKYGEIESNLSQILKGIITQLDLKREIEAEAQLLMNREQAKPNKLGRPKDSDRTKSDERAASPAETTIKLQGNAVQSAEPDNRSASSSATVAAQKPNGGAKRFEVDKKNRKPGSVQSDPSSKKRSDLISSNWIDAFLVIMVILIIVALTATLAVYYIRLRDLREENDNLLQQLSGKTINIRDLHSQLSRQKVIQGDTGLLTSSASQTDEEFDAALRNIDETSVTGLDPIEDNHVSEQEQVDHGQIIEDFVANYKSIIYDDVEKLEGFRKRWDVVGAVRKLGTERDELGTLVFETSEPFNRVDFWCVPMFNINTFLVLPGRKPAATAATLVSDDARPADKLFRGIFDISGGNMFELRVPASAERKGDALSVTTKGKINLPTNSR
jgi:hypothetical protein